MSDFHSDYKLALMTAAETLFGTPAPQNARSVTSPRGWEGTRMRPHQRGARAWWRALTLGAIASVCALLAVLLTLTASTSPPAYALVVNPNGTLTLTINELIGVNGANAELARLGVRARIARVESGCGDRGHFIRVQWPHTGPPPVEPEKLHSGLSGLRMIIHPSEIPPGDTMLLTARLGHTTHQGAPIQIVEMSMGLYRGPAPTCSS
jgi:hypothetical protein